METSEDGKTKRKIFIICTVDESGLYLKFYLFCVRCGRRSRQSQRGQRFPSISRLQGETSAEPHGLVLSNFSSDVLLSIFVLQVCATYMDGFRATVVCPVGGPRAAEKSRRTADSIIKRCGGPALSPPGLVFVSWWSL